MSGFRPRGPRGPRGGRGFGFFNGPVYLPRPPPGPSPWDQPVPTEADDEELPNPFGNFTNPMMTANPMFQQPQGRGPWGMAPSEVLAWLDHQHPFVLRRIHFHVKWLMEQHGVPLDDEDGDGEEKGEGDTSDWFVEDEGSQPKKVGTVPGTVNEPPKPLMSQAAAAPMPPPPPKNPGLGSSSSNNKKAPMQWTPGGWTVKDNSHKITTTMKPLPPPDIIPPGGAKYPEAADDRNKLDLLKNNLAMMTFELNKICRKFRIFALNKDDLSIYPADQQQRLKVAVTCVSNAEKTLNDFKEFLVDEKYKEWNEVQKRTHEEKVKQMIGATPTGTPHKRPEEVPSSSSSDPSDNSSAKEGAELVVSSSGKPSIVFHKGDKLATTAEKTS